MFRFFVVVVVVVFSRGQTACFRFSVKLSISNGFGFAVLGEFASKTSLHRCLQFTTGTRNLQFGRTAFEDSDRYGRRSQVESSDQRRPTNYRK